LARHSKRQGRKCKNSKTVIVKSYHISKFRLILIFISVVKIALLTDRNMQLDSLKSRGDVTVIERTDAPTASQISVIWVQEDGLAPCISGNFIIPTFLFLFFSLLGMRQSWKNERIEAWYATTGSLLFSSFTSKRNTRLSMVHKKGGHWQQGYLRLIFY